MKNKKIFKSILIVIGIMITFVLTLIVFLNANMLYNDLILNSFSKQLYECKIPEETIIIEKHKLCGKLYGNGNGTDFAAIILLQTNFETTKKQVEEYYSSLNFNPAKGKKHTVEIIVESVEQPDFINGYIVNIPLKFQTILKNKDYQYYAVVIFDGGYSAGFDLRSN